MDFFKKQFSSQLHITCTNRTAPVVSKWIQTKNILELNLSHCLIPVRCCFRLGLQKLPRELGFSLTVSSSATAINQLYRWPLLSSAALTGLCWGLRSITDLLSLYSSRRCLTLLKSCLKETLKLQLFTIPSSNNRETSAWKLHNISPKWGDALKQGKAKAEVCFFI